MGLHAADELLGVVGQRARLFERAPLVRDGRGVFFGYLARVQQRERGTARGRALVSFGSHGYSANWMPST